MTRSLAAFIALRYVSVGRRSELVSFMSMLTIGGLALSVCILITVLSVMNGFDREVRENVLGILPHATIRTRENINTERWAQLSEAVLAVRGVNLSAPVLEANGVIAGPDDNVGVLVNGVDPQREADISRLSRFMRAGSLASLGESRFQVVLGETLAQRLGVGLGDSISLYSLNVSINPVAPLPVQRRFNVGGIYRVGTQELDERLVMIALADAQALYRQPDRFTGLRLRTDDVLAVNAVRADIESLLPQGFYLETWTQWFGAIYENIRLSRTIVGFLLWLLVAVAAFNLVVSLIMIVRDKRGDIAILRTMGASPGMIGRIFVLQGCLVGLLGTLIGVLLGVSLALSVSDLFAWVEQLSGAQLLSADVYPVDFLPSELRAGDLIGVSAGVLVLCLLASLYPAWRAARVLPAEALRSE
ncbi:lipoprotein-releasing ABC transporter permease subunit [Pseudohongiella sp.]|uniref:ABC3 transporter permease protein domain-containing protein n=1 Tax=marine sediment metagenome TaxID=412755 RepID=A0A0F9Z3P9_9ZZZZ|nr:lipoprotein-releasing ABC transporter permease subunit [Pseudohongiella sp.]HDZ09022.1 lipoprotein-releasing ABC transporter permease subunit [Pseudohongiella sp.]HEA62707.1 lipoprotein-releasing ABC transporter permease subunit [Pseudohongiella sp.]